MQCDVDAMQMSFEGWLDCMAFRGELELKSVGDHNYWCYSLVGPSIANFQPLSLLHCYESCLLYLFFSFV